MAKNITKPLTPKKLPNKNKAKLKPKLLPNPISKDMPKLKPKLMPFTQTEGRKKLQKMMKDMGLSGAKAANMISNKDVESVLKMQDGGTKRQTREAISKRLKEKGLADVTKEELDRFKKRQKIKGSDKEALRMLLNQRKAKPKVKATGLGDKLLKPFTKERIGARKKQVASDTKAAQDKLAKQKKKAGTIVGGALAAVPTARAATAGSRAVKAVGGAKGIKQAATRARGEIKKEMAARKIGAGKKTTGDLLKGTVQQFTKKQPAIVKRQATIAAKKKKQAEQAAKRKQARSVDTRVKRLDKGARTKQFVNRASGGIFKGIF